MAKRITKAELETQLSEEKIKNIALITRINGLDKTITSLEKKARDFAAKKLVLVYICVIEGITLTLTALVKLV